MNQPVLVACGRARSPKDVANSFACRSNLLSRLTEHATRSRMNVRCIIRIGILKALRVPRRSSEFFGLGEVGREPHTPVNSDCSYGSAVSITFTAWHARVLCDNLYRPTHEVQTQVRKLKNRSTPNRHTTKKPNQETSAFDQICSSFSMVRNSWRARETRA